ncbi:hypothetical protein BVC80_271g5 [Macleaya cordata]|uniref:Uncharacterized protein n=1 Tax=Macleaya cordata TaxID=56857 RepID=A0A200Q174_MACCD|nr:hypothetical protein BVC80_271g5 [Macleaya cordata]
MMLLKESKENLMMREKEETDLHFDDDFEAEEALSLCDLPLTDGDNWEDLSTNSKKNNDFGGVGLSDQEFFEFFSDFKSEMRAAEDIIFCGKLLPYRSPNNVHDHSNQFSTISKRNDEIDSLIELDFKKKRFNPHRKSESLNDLERSKSNVKNRFLKNSYSLDYRKLQRVSSSKTVKTVSEAKDNVQSQIPAGKCFGKNVFSVRSLSIPSSSSSQVKPKKQLVMFGVMKSPAEMELRDIRNRQNKRNPSSLFPETVSVKSNEGKSSWSILRALGCKGHANAAVTASLRCIPHV